MNRDFPIFVLSQPRSGSTLVQRVLNQDRRVLVQGESYGLANRLAEAAYELLDSPDRQTFLEQCFGDSAEVVRRAELRLRNPEDFSATVCSLTASRFKLIWRGLFLELFNPTKEDLRWGFKEVRCCTGHRLLARLIAELFPNASIVMTVRHPVRAIGSCQALNWWPGVDHVKQWNDQASQFKSVARENPRAKIWKYEDFASVDGMERLLSWLNFDEMSELQHRALELNVAGGDDSKKLTAAQEAEIKLACAAHKDLYSDLSQELSWEI